MQAIEKIEIARNENSNRHEANATKKPAYVSMRPLGSSNIEQNTMALNKYTKAPNQEKLPNASPNSVEFKDKTLEPDMS